jgi:hypothetical protein
MFPGGGADQKDDGTLTLSAEDRIVVLGVETNLKDQIYKKIVEALEPQISALKSTSDLATHRSWPHELAAATQTYLKSKGTFPQGALPRPSNGERLLPWRPDQRLSWLADLVPFFGPDYADWRFDTAFGWNEGRNLLMAQRILPHLVATKQIKAVDTHIHYPGVDQPLGATYFVGIAGVGHDAAEYTAEDASKAAKRGVFGYDRVTRKEDIKDGLEQTIVLLMVPGDHKAPWLAGGGGTVRGVSEDEAEGHPLAPFVCTTFPLSDKKTKWDGKRGTLAIMADGKVRFIPEDIPAATFRALCTIAGGDAVSNIDDVAPVIKDDTDRELKSEPGAVAPAGAKPPANPPAAAQGTKPPAK